MTLSKDQIAQLESYAPDKNSVLFKNQLNDAKKLYDLLFSCKDVFSEVDAIVKSISANFKKERDNRTNQLLALAKKYERPRIRSISDTIESSSSTKKQKENNAKLLFDALAPKTIDKVIGSLVADGISTGNHSIRLNLPFYNYDTFLQIENKVLFHFIPKKNYESFAFAYKQWQKRKRTALSQANHETKQRTLYKNKKRPVSDIYVKTTYMKKYGLSGNHSIIDVLFKKAIDHCKDKGTTSDSITDLKNEIVAYTNQVNNGDTTVKLGKKKTLQAIDVEYFFGEMILPLISNKETSAYILGLTSYDELLASMHLAEWYYSSYGNHNGNISLFINSPGFASSNSPGFASSNSHKKESMISLLEKIKNKKIEQSLFHEFVLFSQPITSDWKGYQMSFQFAS